MNPLAEYGQNRTKLKTGSWFGQRLLLYVNKVIDIGGERPYQFKDLFIVPDRFRSKGV